MTTEEQQEEKIARQSAQGAALSGSDFHAGVSRIYDRNKYVDAAKMRESKQNEFAGKRTATTYTGDVVHSSAKAAEHKYGKNASFHQSETDHVMPVKYVYDKHKNSAWLSDDDLRDVINARSNLKEVSRYLNRSKKDMTHFEYIAKNWNSLSKEQIAALGKEQLKADIRLEASIAMKKAKNISATVGEGAKNGLIGAAPGLLAKTVKDIQKVRNGELDAGEAIEDMAGTVGKVAATGAAIQVAGQQAAKVAERFLNTTLDVSLVGKIAGAVMVLKDCAAKFAKGEIQSEEFCIQMIEDGTGYVASAMIYASIGSVGLAAGLAVSAVASIVQGVYDTVKQELRMGRDSKRKLEETEKITAYILEKEKRYQDILKEFRGTLEEKREKAFAQLLCSMQQSVMGNDIDSFFRDMNDFGKSYGVQFQFETFQEFDDFMNDEDAVFQF